MAVPSAGVELTCRFLGTHSRQGIKFKEMINIQTIVYFDLESTVNKESGKPRISVISLVAVNVFL